MNYLSSEASKQFILKPAVSLKTFNCLFFHCICYTGVKECIQDTTPVSF